MKPEQADNPASIRARIDYERAELSHTVEALAHKVDVKARAQEKAEELKARAQDRAEAAVGAAREAVGSAVAVARRPTVLWPAAGVVAALAAIVVIIRRIAR